MSEQVASTTFEKILLTSELIFAKLHEDNGLDLTQIKQQVEWQSPLFDWALGYLIGLGDVEITDQEGTLHAKRKLDHYIFWTKNDE